MSASSALHGAVGGARNAITDEPVGVMARVGLAARGVTYLLLGVLTFMVARGARSDVDQKGVLDELLERPAGGIAVGLLALGFACYAAWRFWEAATGVRGTGGRAWPRVQSFGRGLVYSALTITAVSVLLGSRSSQGGQQKGLVSRLVESEPGRWFVLIAGATVVAVGAFLVYEGVTQTFMRWFPAGALSPRARTVVRRLGTVGTTARGVVFAIAGALVVVAAWTYQPSKAGGVDSVVSTLRAQPYGQALLLAMAFGLIAFGIYGLAEARYRRVT